MNLNDQLPWRPLARRLNGEKQRVKFMALVAALAFSGQAGARTTNLLINFEGTLDGTNYVLGSGEIDTTSSFGANGSPVIQDGQAQLGGSGMHDLHVDGFRFDPSMIGSLTTTNWVAEAVVAFNTFDGKWRTVINVPKDANFRINSAEGSLEALHWDGSKSRSTHVKNPERCTFIHLALAWNAEETRLTAYTNGVSIGTVGHHLFFGEGPICFGYFGHKGREGRGIDGLLHAVSFSTSDTVIPPSDFLINILPPDPPPLPPSGSVDPRFPSEQIADQPEDWARWPRMRIRELEAERNQLLEKISILPQHHPIFLFSHLGYHSRLDKIDSAEALPPHQITYKWEWSLLLDSIALAPAFNPKQPGIYAFPKRFKIEVIYWDSRGFETLVDWMEEDFPDPGPYPVFFSEINRVVTQMRITVPQVVRESGMAYFALGEIYLLRQRPDGSTGANMAAWESCQIEVSGSFSMPPLWDVEYLHDGLTGLGFPLSDERVESKDLMVVFDDEECPDEVQLLLDLGHVQKIGRIDFWPAAPPAGLALPSFGWPKELSVELSRGLDFKTAEMLMVEGAGDNLLSEQMLSVEGDEYSARYIRVTIRGLFENEGQRILGLGEIVVTEAENILSSNCKVTAKGIPEEDLDQLPLLVDGCSWQRRILPVGEWVKGLAQRRPLDRRLARVERELGYARADWYRIKQQLSSWAVGIVVMSLIGGLMLQRKLRQRGLDKLKRRITRDLHDDVGSNLGSISLTAEQLKHSVVDAEAKEELSDLCLLAREACASLREVVWVVDGGLIRLPALIHKLVERTERVLGGMELSFETPEDCLNCIVSLTFKRHLIMFFKEGVHNCARHSQATRVWVDFSTDDQCLKVSIRDNGCGFNPAEASLGLGLESMQERAEEMGGGLKLDSQPGEGTTVILTVPLTALQSKVDRLYKTSN